MKTTPSSKWLYIKIGLYGFLLYSIFNIMQYVKSPTFSSNVDVLMGSPSQARTFNWCPNNVQIVSVAATEITLRDPKQIEDACQLSYTSYNADEVRDIEWTPLFKALNEKGEETVLWVDSSYIFVKKNELVYKVESLKDKLTRIGISTL